MDLVYPECKFLLWKITESNDKESRSNFCGKSDLETVNPLTWKTTGSVGASAMHKGAVVKDFNSVKPHVLSTQIKSNKLVISTSSDSIEIPDRLENLHVLDINLFYVDIRDNLRARVAAHKKKTWSLQVKTHCINFYHQLAACIAAYNKLFCHGIKAHNF